MNWTKRGKVFFGQFQGLKLGEMMIAETAEGWVCGAKMLGNMECAEGYYALKNNALRSSSRDEAEANAKRMAEKSNQRLFLVNKHLEENRPYSSWSDAEKLLLMPVRFL